MLGVLEARVILPFASGEEPFLEAIGYADFTNIVTTEMSSIFSGKRRTKMDQLTTVTALVSFVAGLSVATERITEAIKRLPFLSDLLSKPKTNSQLEDTRVILVYTLSAVVGAILCSQTQGALSGLLPSKIQPGFLEYTFFGILSSGGSGFWNSALDYLRRLKK